MIRIKHIGRLQKVRLLCDPDSCGDIIINKPWIKTRLSSTFCQVVFPNSSCQFQLMSITALLLQNYI